MSFCPITSWKIDGEIVQKPINRIDKLLYVNTMASGPITLWEIDGETVETVSDFILLGSKIPVDGDSSHEIKRHFLLGKIAMKNLDKVLKSRHHFANKGLSN